MDNSYGQDEGSIDVTWGDGSWVGEDLGLRLVATAITAILSLALLTFLFYRLRRRRLDRLAGTKMKVNFCSNEFIFLPLVCHGLDEGGDAPSTSSLTMFNEFHSDLTSTGHLSRYNSFFKTLGVNLFK